MINMQHDSSHANLKSIYVDAVKLISEADTWMGNDEVIQKHFFLHFGFLIDVIC